MKVSVFMFLVNISMEVEMERRRKYQKVPKRHTQHDLIRNWMW